MGIANPGLGPLQIIAFLLMLKSWKKLIRAPLQSFQGLPQITMVESLRVVNTADTLFFACVVSIRFLYFGTANSKLKQEGHKRR